MNQRIPESLQPILENYIALVDQHLPDLVEAVYLEGSIALGEFNERFSDIDFVAMLNRQVNLKELEHLRQIHKRIEKDYPRWKLSGSYLQWDDLGHNQEKAGRLPHYHDGVLRTNGRFESDSVTSWILKNYGIALVGPTSQGLSFSVDWDRLSAKMRDNLNSYWVRWTKRPDRILVMLSDWGIQWCILGVLRQYYSFRESRITTKVRAGEYGLKCVPTRWHRLIREAIRIRESKENSAYRFRTARTVDAIRFLNYIMQTCNAGFKDS